MPAAVEATGSVVAQAALPGGRQLLTVSAPDVARLAGPGQFAMLRAADGLDPYLRRALPFLRVGGRGGPSATPPLRSGQGLRAGPSGYASGLGGGSSPARETVSFLFTPSEPGLAWLARRRLGDPIRLTGPLGRGFDLQPGARRLLLIAVGEPVAPLLALADRALAAQVSVSLAASETFLGTLASIIPEAVELATAPEEGLWDLAAGLLLWADQAAAAGPADDLKRLSHLGRTIRAGLVQCYVQASIACGLGWCGTCLTELRRGPRRACTGGPVFDLIDLS